MRIGAGSWGWYGSRKGSEYTGRGGAWGEVADGFWYGGAMPANGFSLSLALTLALLVCIGDDVEDSSGGCV